MTDRRKKIITLVSISVLVLLISIGFAAFSAKLSINTTATFTADASKFSVVFSKNQNSAVDGEVTPTKNPTTIQATNGVIDYDTAPTTISNLSATFTQPGQSTTYSFFVYNKGIFLAYLNSITFLGDKVCTAGTGATKDLVDQACESIKVNVSIGSVTTSQTKTNIIGEEIDAKTGKQIIITLEYASDGARSDGPFEVEFGDVSMYFATVSGMNEIVEGTCKIKSGSIDTPGSYVQCGTEYFYIVSRNTSAETVTLLADKNITLTTSNPVQSSSAGTIAFSDNLYWAEYYEYVDASGTPYDSGYTLKEKYSNGFIYDSNSLLYPYVEAYETNLKSMGINGVSANLISDEQLSTLGVGYNTASNYVGSWQVYPNYWLGSANNENVYSAHTQDGIYSTSYTDSSTYGIRPLITIPESEIN